MTLQRRIEILEQRYHKRVNDRCRNVRRKALASLSDQDLDLYEQYVGKERNGLEPTIDEVVAAGHYQDILKAECQAVGFRSIKEFEEAERREIACPKLSRAKVFA